MVQPVRGYEFGVPDEAVGVTTNGEVKIFDEDEVDKHLGAGVDLDGNLHGGDSDVVGARSQTLYGEIDKDEEIDYLDDYVIDSDTAQAIDDVRALLQSLADVNGTAGGLLPPGSAYGPYGPLGWLTNWTIDQATQAFGGAFAAALTNPPLPGTPAVGGQTGSTSLAQYEMFLAIPSWADLAATYSKDYDGVILNRETWEYHEDHADLDDDPDDDDDPAPFFADPRDWADVASNLAGVENTIGSEIDSIQTHWGDTGATVGMNPVFGAGWYYALVAVCSVAGFGDGYAPNTGELYEFINYTIKAEIDTWKLPAASKAFLLGSMTTPNNLTSKGAPNAYVQDWVAGLYGFVDVVLETVYFQFKALIPDKAGFFLGQLIAGQPAMTPSGDFMTKVIEEYNFDEDGETLYDMYGFEYGKDLNSDGEIDATPYGAVSRFSQIDLNGETVYPQAFMEFEWDGSAVIAEIEWQEDSIDPKDWVAFGGDGEDELEDFEIEFPYGDTGGQGTVSYMDGDEIFWQMGGVDQIPGFEISILLGASAIAILGLIYVVMKKRKM
jgi:hypothetical protein